MLSIASILYHLPSAPVSCIPAATTNSTTTVRTPSLENPLIPSSIVIIFAHMHAVKAVSITKSAYKDNARIQNEKELFNTKRYYGIYNI